MTRSPGCVISSRCLGGFTGSSLNNSQTSLHCVDSLDALAATFPAGTLSGAPKIRAMEIIDELEPARRGLYGGGIGYVDLRGNLDFCITIRTVVLRGGQAFVQAGAGIVADSDPAAEERETEAKAGAVFEALRLAGGLAR